MLPNSKRLQQLPKRTFKIKYPHPLQKKEPVSVGTVVRVRQCQMGGKEESCCVYICKAAGRQHCVRLRLWPNLGSSLLLPTHQSSKTGPPQQCCMLGDAHAQARTLCGTPQHKQADLHNQTCINSDTRTHAGTHTQHKYALDFKQQHNYRS